MNYMPITLLSAVHKVLAKLMANRLEPVLQKAIHASQTAFMHGRQLTDNSRTVMDVIEMARQKKWTGALLFLDWEKAYDVCDWDWVDKCLGAIGVRMEGNGSFGELLHTLHHRTERRVLINGNVGPAFRIRASVPQGSPLAALLYIVSCEPLHQWIREEKRIHGIKLPGGSVIKGSAFADDTCLFVKDTQSLVYVRRALNMYCAASAASVNHDKTVGVMLGGHPQWQQQIMQVDRWVKDNECERYLGAFFGDQDQVNMHWDKAISKMKSRDAKWAMRELSIYGRCLVHKASIASCLWFMCTVMDTPEHAQIEIRNIMNSVIWRGDGTLIKHDVACMPQPLGGFKKMDVNKQLDAHRAKWIKRYLDPGCTGSWVHILRAWLEELSIDNPDCRGLGDEVCVANPGGKGQAAIDRSSLPKFWKQCLKAMWKLKLVRVPGTRDDSYTLHTHRFRTVTIIDHCTVQYNNEQWLTLDDFSVKMAYWCMIKHAVGHPVPNGQAIWIRNGAVVEWPVAWSNIRSPSISKKQAGRSLKLMHRACEASTALVALATCDCGHQHASMWHGLFECVGAMRAWAGVERWWHRLGGHSCVMDPIHKLTVTTAGRLAEVESEVWRLLCSCMLDVLWVRWTGWVHQQRQMTVTEVLRRWERDVHERVTLLWVRANRLCEEYDCHVNYVPGCTWSKPKEDHIGAFRQTWEGPLGVVMGSRWVPSQLL